MILRRTVMPRKKLSKNQIKEARKQVREVRENQLFELESNDQAAYEEKLKNIKEKKDKLGFTRDERKEISEKQIEINKPKVKVSWNFKEGELVYLANGEVGIIVQNNAKDIELQHNFYDMKKSLNRYDGQVYVVTSSGNNWYYPKTLKPVR